MLASIFRDLGASSVVGSCSFGTLDGRADAPAVASVALFRVLVSQGQVVGVK